LTEAVRSFNEALGIDKNHQTAKDHLEKIQQQIKVMEAQVGGACLLTCLQKMSAAI